MVLIKYYKYDVLLLPCQIFATSIKTVGSPVVQFKNEILPVKLCFY